MPQPTPAYIATPAEIADHLTEGQRLLGLDVGSVVIGLAISDSALKIASPIGSLKRKDFEKTAKALTELCAERNVGGLIIGLPISMDGSEGRKCQSVRQFAVNLMELADFRLPIAFWDERLSTAAVERFLIEEADMSRKRRSEVVDKMAAAFILQGALDTIGRARSEG
jgi:putative Holliday junction resolvase